MEQKKYIHRIRRERMDDMKRAIHNYIFIGKRYRRPGYSAKDLASDMNVDPRYISAAVSYHYGCNFSELVNRMRIDDAKPMLADATCTMTIEEIADSVGFKNRQSFYNAFQRFMDVTPVEYRDMMTQQPSTTPNPSDTPTSSDTPTPTDTLTPSDTPLDDTDTLDFE